MLGSRSLRSPARNSMQAGWTKGASKKPSSVVACSAGCSQPTKPSIRQIKESERCMLEWLVVGCLLVEGGWSGKV